MMPTENFRFCIKVRSPRNISVRTIILILRTVNDDEVPGLRTVKPWSKLFHYGLEEIEDKARSDRHITETTAENIEQIQLIINDAPHITIEDIQEQTDLNLRKVTTCYIPKDLTGVQRAESVRICKENLLKLQQGTWCSCDGINVDESWFRHK